MKYSFLMPYAHRPALLAETFKSFVSMYSNRDDYEVILIEKHVNDIPLASICETFPIPTKIFTCDIETVCPARSYNIAGKNAQGSYYILTNPECRHDSDVLGGFDELFAQHENSYIVCACKALDEEGRYIQWYQHSKYNNSLLNFCAAIPAHLWKVLGGFNDERFSAGWGFEDNEWLERVRQHPEIDIVAADDLLVSHQYHETTYRNMEQFQRNRLLFHHLAVVKFQ